MTAQQLQPLKPKPAIDAPAISPKQKGLGWRLLGLLNGYRLILAVLLAAIVALGSDASTVIRSGMGSTSPIAFIVLCSAYVAAGALLAGLHRSRSPELPQQAMAHLLTDTTMICLLTAMSGGVSSGLAILLPFSLATCAMVMGSRTTLTSAAFITLALFISELFATAITDSAPALTQTGILCATLFAVGWIAPRLASRVAELEVLVSQSSDDIARLQHINAEVVSQLDDGVITVDAGDRIELYNAAALQLLGKRDPKYRSPLFDLSPDLTQQLARWREHAAPLPTHQKRYKLSFRSATDDRRRGGAVLLLQDLSEQHRQVHQTKLAAMGRLTASIAHEIRNPLNAIKQAGQLLQEAPGLQADPQNARLLDMVQRHSDRINGIVESVMQLSSNRPAAPTQLNLAAEIKATVADHCDASDLSPEQITSNIDQNLMVQFDRGQLRQILQPH